MIVVGLTGGIGTGKSEVARILQELGAALINADHVGHEAYTPHTEPWQAVVEAFGEGILQPDGQIDRRKLGGMVFGDPEQLTLLNGIMHPRMGRMVANRIEECRQRGDDVVVVEAAVLFEAGWETLVDEVWTTESPVELVIARLEARNGLSQEEVRKRIGSQMSAEERSSRATVVVGNAGELSALKNTVNSLWDTRVKGRVEQK